MMSDLDTRDRYYGFSDEDIARLQAEEAREQRWDEFVSTMKVHYWTSSIPVARALVDALYFEGSDFPVPVGSLTEAILDFKDGQQWSDVYGALARAARQVEQERERLLTQG